MPLHLKLKRKPWVVEIYDSRDKSWVVVGEEDTRAEAEETARISSATVGVPYRARNREIVVS